MDPQFVADDHLGKLARWLRMLGFDVLWRNPVSDKELLAASRDRTLLTRHRKLVDERRAEEAICIASDRLMEQLKQVITEKNLTVDPARFFTRCALCNHPLKPVDKSAVESRLPDHVRETQTRFYLCEGCDHVYWEGTHVARVLEKLRAIGVIR